ncbi:MAG: C-GCAxxG-C-C family protein [Negativicutes bacterium]|nr:C-GCAxxG-C-C family protein [Negativicutes bacterium]
MNNERVSQAISRFEGGMSCSQAVLSTYGPCFGLCQEDALRVARGFGGGMARLSQTCGAVTGAFMTIGLTLPGSGKEAKDDTYALIRKFAETFTTANGSLNCTELIGCDLGTPEGQTYFRENGLMKSCTKYVTDAAEILEEMLQPKP